MKKVSKASVQFLFAVALAAAAPVAFQLQGTEALAQSTYFTSRGCVDCHAAPTVATCAGCHHHSGTIAATTNKTTSYAPGESVTITLTSSGARSGWIGVRLYNQSGVEIARSTGNQSGMGGSAVYPASLSAPAPATAGAYTWRIAYFGNEDGTGTGDVHSEKSVNVSFTVAAAVDTTIPVVSAFTLPATATSLTVPVSSFTATDNVGVTGYLINKVATAPLASAAGWTATAPASVTAVAGSNTFYAWAKDAAGNVSLAKTASVTVTLPDTTVPVVSAFTLPATATSLTVPVSSFTATDNAAVTGYLITTSATAPAASAAGWTATAPASVTAVAGSNTFYAWAKDAAGNVSLAKSASVMVAVHKIISKDFDGDGKTDLAVWDPSTYNWFILNSATGNQSVVNYGTSGDVTVSGDYDGDGKIDIAVWRPSNGTWYILNSSTGVQGAVKYGTSGDVAVPGDYDGDGKTDIAVWRPSNGTWYILNSSTGAQSVVNYGTSGDIAVPGDYDGDGKADIAVWRNGSWFIKNSATATQSVVNYGATGDVPAPGDYDGIGKTEIAIWRPAEGNWYILNSATSTQRVVQLGITSDQPVK